MSVSSVASNNWVSQITNTAQVRGRRGSDGDADDGVQGSRQQGGGFAAAIANALKQIGVTSQGNSSTGSTASNSDSSSQDPTQALSTFMQNLMAALHAQQGNTQATATQSSASGTDGDGDQDGSQSVSGTGHRHHHRQELQSDLHSLLQQLSSSGSGNASADANSTTSALEQSFQNLLSATGDKNSNATLSDFLQALSGQLSGATKVGNAVSASA